MDQQQKIEISVRLKELRNNSAETNRSIAEAAGVGERSVANWMSAETGLKYENAVAVAALFDVDVNWLWTGRPAREQGPTPDPFARPDPTLAALERIEARLDELEAGQAEMARRRKPKSGKTNTTP